MRRWRREQDSNLQPCYRRRLSRALPRPVGLSPQLVRVARFERARKQGLSLPPLPIGLHARNGPGERSRTSNKHGLNVPRLPVAPRRDGGSPRNRTVWAETTGLQPALAPYETNDPKWCGSRDSNSEQHASQACASTWLRQSRMVPAVRFELTSREV